MEGCTSLSPPIDVVPMHLEVLPVMGGGGGGGGGGAPIELIGEDTIITLPD